MSDDYSQLSIENRIDFIDATPLATLDDSELATLRDSLADTAAAVTNDDAKNKASLSGSNPILYTDEVTDDQKNDVEWSVLFAQLATAAKYRGDQWGTPEAYKFYVSVLNHVGWIISMQEYKELSSARVTGNLDTLMISLLAESSPGMKSLFSKVIEAMKGSGVAQRVFDRSVASDNNAMFQSSTVHINSKRVEIGFGAYGFQAKEHVHRVLFWSFTHKSAKFYHGYTRAHIAPDIMKEIRETLKKKLIKYIKDYIIDIPIEGL